MISLKEILAENKSSKSQLLADFITRIADNKLGSALKFIDNFEMVDESGKFTMSLYRDVLSEKALSVNWTDDEFASISYWNEYAANPDKPDKEILFEDTGDFTAMKPVVMAVFDRLVSCKEDKDLLENVIFQDGVVINEDTSGDSDDDIFAALASKIGQKRAAKSAAAEAKAAKDAKKNIPILYANPDYVFDDIRASVTSLCEDSIYHGIVIAGPGGLGKSVTVESALNDAGMRPGLDWVKFKVRMTPPEIYLTLLKHYDKVVIFDDCDEVLLNKTAANIFKAAIDTGEKRLVSWYKSNTIDTNGLPNEVISGLVQNDKEHRLPSTFQFTGSIIFITNLPVNKIESALLTRCDVIDVTMKQEDIGSLIRKELPNVKVLAQNRVTGETTNIGTNLALKHEVLDFLLSPEYQEHMRKYNLPFNFRLFQRAYTFAYRDDKSWKRRMFNLTH